MSRTKDYRVLIGFGQLFLIAGFLCLSLMAPAVLEGTVGTILADEQPVRFFQGFACGLAIPLLGASIYMNTRGLVLYRRERIGS